MYQRPIGLRVVIKDSGLICTQFIAPLGAAEAVGGAKRNPRTQDFCLHSAPIRGDRWTSLCLPRLIFRPYRGFEFKKSPSFFRPFQGKNVGKVD